MTTIENASTRTTAPKRLGGAASRPVLRPFVVGAICRRDLARYFTNVAGYVFIVLFIATSSVAAFWPEAFFANNLATLGQLNELMPYLLLLFIPAITMSVWADERRQGTEELLLTLPARDLEVVLGKYLAALGIYTAALGFLAFGLTLVLAWLGRPDLGVLLSTFLGYWLMGGMLLALGMVASLLSGNVTVAFILGALFCAVPVFAELLGGLSSTEGARAIEAASVPAQFREFGRGVVPISGVCYFIGLAAAMLYVNVALVGRRHWAGGEKSSGLWGHALVRILAVIVAVLSLQTLVARAGWRPDLSAERLNTLSDESRSLIKNLPSDRPVFIEAFFSPEVPREYVEAKQNLVGLLKEFDALGGQKIQLNLVEAERFSEEARRAEQQYGIAPRNVFTASEGRQGFDEILMGVAFTSGPEQVVIPFFDRGLPVEYELTRSIRTVAGAGRRKVGILDTDVGMLGRFDFRSMAQNREWQVVTELRKQYEVTSVSADSEIPADLDALIVPQPSSLTQPQIDNLVAYVQSGGPTLLFMDPLPQFDRSPQMNLAPTQPKEQPGGMFGGGPPPEPKGDLTPLLELLGIEWPQTEIVWNPYNPHPKFTELPPEYVFISPSSGAPDAFNPKDPITSGLQELIVLFGGYVRPRVGGGPDFTPLLRTNEEGGIVRFESLTTPGFFGIDIDPDRAVHIATGQDYTLAARIEGDAPATTDEDEDADGEGEGEGEEKKAEARGIHALVVMDLDLISDGFFQLRQSGSEEFEFDNVTFVLNAVDSLVGDDSFIDLRKQRRRHRTLTLLEERDRAFEAERLEQEAEAEKEANEQLDAARARMDEKIAKIEANEELDDRTKQVMLAQVREVEQRRLTVAEANIEDAKRRKIEESFAAKERQIRAIRGRVRLAAAIIPPLPALILGIVVAIVRSRRENRGATPTRLA
ncbi:Gldg family protein [Tautonia sociabilis]|uniref:ABC transporter n=1 Tax=Tautonia sociabilis TaxID=2080755 RepID=A0A432MCQ4_9BACT|nr:Gldg family protein [Tautonia sociabilis]RUL82164.1 ABC transporter [Tautonia sociabilis]